MVQYGLGIFNFITFLIFYSISIQEKPVIIPEHRRDKNYMQSVPSFVRNVMGSSAGAGSGEFHVYRHLRRKEYARQKMIQHKSIQEQLDDEYQEKLEENRRIAEEKTAKKRAKRLKKKQRAKKSRKETSKNAPAKENEADSSSDDDDDNDSPPKMQDSDEGSNLPSDIQEVEVANVDASTENNNCKPEVSTCEQRIEDVKNSEDSIQQETLN